MSRIVQVWASKLIEDFSIYPRNTVYDGHVTEIKDAIEAGATIPPILVDRSTKRIVDGVHRRRALIRLFGPDAVVAVEYRTYKSEGEIKADAIRTNVGRGSKDLCAADIHRATMLLREEGWDDSRIAGLVGLTNARLAALIERKTAFDSKGNTVLLRRPIHHLAGQTLTPQQVDAAGLVRSGVSYMSDANRLIHAVTNGLLADDPDLYDRLHVLADLIQERVPRME